LSHPTIGFILHPASFRDSTLSVENLMWIEYLRTSVLSLKLVKMDNWKDRKKIYDTKICKQRTKQGNVYGSKALALEQRTIRAIFHELLGEPYLCGTCKKWHFTKG
jgi:hypothetical protein